jgi:hypothetical protein
VTVFEELAAELRKLASNSAREVHEPVQRFVVDQVSPLRLVGRKDPGLVLEDGDEDFEVAHALVTAPPALGDVVLVATIEDGDYLAFEVVKTGG